MSRLGGRTRQLVIVGGALVGLSGSTAGAALNFEAARKLCRSQGGTFSADPDFYRCVFLDGEAPTLSERKAARKLCEGRYRGDFEYAAAAEYTDPAYGCDVS